MMPRTPLVAADLRIRRPQAIRVPVILAQAVLALAAIGRGAMLLVPSDLTGRKRNRQFKFSIELGPSLEGEGGAQM